MASQPQQVLVKGGAVGVNRHFLHKPGLVHVFAQQRLHVRTQALAIGRNRLRNARGDGRGNAFQRVRPRGQIASQSRSFPRAHGAQLGKRLRKRFGQQRAQFLAVFLGLADAHHFRHVQYAHQRAVVREPLHAVHGLYVGARQGGVHRHHARVLAGAGIGEEHVHMPARELRRDGFARLVLQKEKGTRQAQVQVQKAMVYALDFHSQPPPLALAFAAAISGHAVDISRLQCLSNLDYSTFVLPAPHPGGKK